MRGVLKASRPNGRAVIYTKAAILEWLGVKPEPTIQLTSPGRK
jgi:hypothetical protein